MQMHHKHTFSPITQDSLKTDFSDMTFICLKYRETFLNQKILTNSQGPFDQYTILPIDMTIILIRLSHFILSKK